MIRYILKRIVLLIFTLWAIITITFFAINLTPGNPFQNDKLSPEKVEQLNQAYGFDRPLTIQYVDYMNDLVHGDLRRSFTDNQKVTDIIITRFPNSMKLGLLGVGFGALIGISLGIAAALNKNTIIDYFATFVSVLGVSLPAFVIATLTQYVFAVKLQWVPTNFTVSDSWTAWILPVFSLSLFAISSTARMTRTEMVEVLNSNFLELAKAKGVNKRTRTYKHALRNALIPIITVLGPLTISLMTGSLVVESIFAIPGLGGFLVQGVLAKNLYVVMGAVTFYSILFLVMFLIIDILYVIIDPRIRLGRDK